MGVLKVLDASNKHQIATDIDAAAKSETKKAIIAGITTAAFAGIALVNSASLLFAPMLLLSIVAGGYTILTAARAGACVFASNRIHRLAESERRESLQSVQAILDQPPFQKTDDRWQKSISQPQTGSIIER